MKATNTLKGIAIIAVLINHYLNLNIHGNSTGFANAWIAIFFFLSGYGIFFSLSNANYKSNKYGIFYIKRLVRIFPLLWIAWLIQMLVTNGNVSFWVPTGLHGSGHFWFIPAIIQCYLIAPILYLFTKKRPLFTVMALFILVLGINYLLYMTNIFSSLKIALNFINARWRYLYFLHILVFATGMLFAAIIRVRKPVLMRGDLIHKVFFWGILLLINIFMVLLKINFNLSVYIKITFEIIPIFLIVLFSVYAILYSVENSVFEYFGKISYSIYLFHISLYLFINNMGSFQKNSIYELAVTLTALPFFVVISSYIENKSNIFSNKVFGFITKKYIQQGSLSDRHSVLTQ